MDASAYLSRQGWRGPGHGLSSSGRGIKKPLLVSKKSSSLGIGRKAIDVHADAWWSRVFDAGLKNIDIQRHGTEGPSTPSGELSLFRAGGKKWTGLYDGFVKGSSLAGTMPTAAIKFREADPMDSPMKSKTPKLGQEGTTPTSPCDNSNLTPHGRPLLVNDATSQDLGGSKIKRRRKQRHTVLDRHAKSLIEAGPSPGHDVEPDSTIELPVPQSTSFSLSKDEPHPLASKKIPGSLAIIPKTENKEVVARSTDTGFGVEMVRRKKKRKKIKSST